METTTIEKHTRTRRAVPTVNVYSKHRPDCRFAGVASKIGCSCPKQLAFYQNGRMHRVSPKTCDGQKALDEAEKLTAKLAAQVKGEPVPVTADDTTTLDAAVKTFLDTKTASGVTEKHIAKLKYELGVFVQFLNGRGILNLTAVKTEDVLAFRNSLTGHQNTRAKKIFRLIGFFEFAVELGWLQRNPARAQAVVIKYAETQTPKALDDKQFAQLLAAVQKVNGQTTDEQRRKLRSLAVLMRWTGLSLRDALCIERSRFEKNGDGFNKLFLRRAKTGHAVCSTLRASVVEQVLSGANATGKYLFIDSVPETEKGRDLLVNQWVTLFAKLGTVADLKDADGQPYKFTSHSLRHSFVLWALNKGLPTEDVATLIGDSPQIVLQHYSEWITARQERLDERLKAVL